MRLSQLFSVCLFGHDDPIKVLKGKKLHFECSRCHQDLGIVLPKQKLKVRKSGTVVHGQFTRKRA